MLGFEGGWDERGQGLGKGTSRVRTQRGSQPETLESNETWTYENDQVIREGEINVKLHSRALTIFFRCNIEVGLNEPTLVCEIDTHDIGCIKD